jgi:hypothetical protein
MRRSNFGKNRNSSSGGRIWTPDQLGDVNALQNLANPLTYNAATVRSYPVLTSSPGTLTTPRSGRAWLFDGVNDYATLGARLTSGSVTTLSVCAWVKLTVNGDRTIACEHNSGGQRSWWFGVGAGKIYFDQCTTGGPNDYKSTYSNATYNDGLWHHVMAVFDSGNSAIYVDGVAVATTVTSSGTQATTLFDSTAFLTVGSDSTAAFWFFNGSLRNVRVYSTAKTAPEILAIYNQASTPTTLDRTGLLAAYWCEEESGLVGYDWSGNGKHLTLTNIIQSTFHASDTGVTYSAANELGNSKSLSFDGSNDRATAPNVSALAITGDVTLSAWVYVNVAAYNFVFVKESASGWAAEYDLFIRGDGLIAFKGGNGVNTEGGVGTTTGSVPVKTWTHICAVRSGSSYSVYINGVHDTTVGYGVGTSVNTPLRIGCRETHGTAAIIIRDARVYNVAKTAGEALSIKNGGAESSGLVAKWNDSYDESGNGYNLTLENGTATHVIPRNEATPTLDAGGTAIGVSGQTMLPAVAEVPCITGDGSTVYADLGSALIPASADFDISTWYYHATGSATIRSAIDQRSATHTGIFGVVINLTESGGLRPLANAITVTLDNVQYINSSVALVPATWNAIRCTRVGNLFTLYLNGVSVGTSTYALTISQGQATQLLVYKAGASYGQYSDGRLSDFRITTGGVTKYFPLQGGPGTSNTNRDLHWVDSAGSGGVVSGAIVNGTVANIWANRCPYAQDWCVNYGGGIAANGAFIPGRIGSANDAAGNAKTLTAGKFGNPYSRPMLNNWSVPSLVTAATPARYDELPCLTGDGSAVYAVSASNIGISGAANRTVTFTAKSTRTGTQEYFIGWGVASSQAMFSIGNNGFNWWIKLNGTDVNTGVTADTNWHNHAVTYDGTSVRWYLDGALIYTVAATVNTTDSTVSLLRRQDNVNFGANRMLNCRIYSDVKTLAEIAAINTGFENRTNLVVHWTCQEGSGRTIYDTVGTNDLTLVGGTVAAIWANTTDGTQVHSRYALEAIIPRNTKFRRTASDGDDKFFTSRAALTGTVLTDARGYTA